MDVSKIYLAGPIAGCSYTGSNGWREYITENVKDNIVCLNPLRGKEYLSKETKLQMQYDDKPLSSARAITTRDRFDATRCDILVVNMLDATEKSIGTTMEIAWADSKRIPILLIMEKQGNVHEHPMLTECVGWRTDSLEEAVEIINNIL